MSDQLECHRHPKTAADTQRSEAAPCLTPSHLVQQRDDDARTRAADGVPERDGSAVYVDTRGVDRQIAKDREDLRRKGFVQLDEVKILELQSGPLKELSNRRHGTDAHHPRVNACRCPSHNAREWRESATAAA